jgi:predicted DNA-binding protein
MEMLLMSHERKQVTVRFETDLYQRLQEAAKRDDRPLASMIRKACEAATAKPEDQHVAA